MYLEIDRKWLVKNMKKLAKEYEKQTGERGKILIATEDIAKIEDWASEKTVSVVEGNDHIFCSVEVPIELDTIIEALEYWTKKLNQIKKITSD